MKKYRYYCEITLGNMSIVETEMQKKAMIGFLKSFLVKPDIGKIKCDEPHSTSYYYQVDVNYVTSNYLQLLRFSESLRAFCLFWRMSLIELDLSELPS